MRHKLLGYFKGLSKSAIVKRGKQKGMVPMGMGGFRLAPLNSHVTNVYGFFKGDNGKSTATVLPELQLQVC